METANWTSTARWTNSINGIGFKAFNSLGTINRVDIWSSYSQETLNNAWRVFTNFIIKNYQSGKGTYIKSFGTFTFTNVEYSWEGTTNQFNRDIKLRRPVFIVSKDFVETLRPGQYTKNGGLVYYTQKPNNSIGIVKWNFAELAYGINVSKEEYVTIFYNIIHQIGNELRTNTFRNKELPGWGILMLRVNVFGVKFFTDFSTNVQKIPQKWIQVKRNIGLHMDVENTKGSPMDDLPNAEKAIGEIRPKTTVITHLTDKGEKWWKENMDIDCNELEKDWPINTKPFIENSDTNQRFEGSKFFTKGALAAKAKWSALKQLSLNNILLEALASGKGQMIKEMKTYDRRNNGMIGRFELIRSIVKSNIHPNLTMNIINDIVSIYASDWEYIDYFKVVTCWLKDIKLLLKQDKQSWSWDNSFNKSDVVQKSMYSTTFNQKFKLGPNKDMNKECRSLSISGSLNQNLNMSYSTLSSLTNYGTLSVSVNEVENEIKSIKLVMKDLMSRPRLNLEKSISFLDLNDMLHWYSITYTTEKIIKILKFVNVANPNSFTIVDFSAKLSKCKVTSYEMMNEDISQAYDTLISYIKSNGGRNLLFKSADDILHLKEFLILFENKTAFTNNVLTAIFEKLTNKKNSFTLNDYIKWFETQKNSLNLEFYKNTMDKLNAYRKGWKITINDYFNKILAYNFWRENNVLNKEHFILAFQQEQVTRLLNEQELEYLFTNMDKNKDGIVDRDEFWKAIDEEHNSLIKMQDIIKRMQLNIEDWAYRLEINREKNEKITFYQFKNKLRKFDSSYTNQFIEGLFCEIAGSLDKLWNTNDLIRDFDVFRKEHFRNTNNETFKTNFIQNIQKQVDYLTIKNAFEDVDKRYTGKITKEVFCKVINRFTQEFKDEDIMKFVRITQLTDTYTYEVNYPDFINWIYYNAKLDQFLLCVEMMKNIWNECKNDFHEVIKKINTGVSHENYINIDTLYEYLRDRMDNPTQKQTWNKVAIRKFDLDSDGKISFEDWKGVLGRYISTSFFKYENDSHGQEVNWYSSENLSDKEFKEIVREMKSIIKKKNVTEIGLFRKLDEDKDGFISNHEFNKNIGQIITLAPATKDKIFNYLDYYHNGLVDLETFLKRFKEFKSKDIIMRNNNTIENVIINEFAEWINNSKKKWCDTEIFSIMDQDSDGIISWEDFKHFVIDSLLISKIEFNDYKLERVMQSISWTKNKNIGLGDVREFMNRATTDKTNSYYVDLKETFKETTNQNWYKGKENTEWISQAIERFGMYISEKFDDVETFYSKFSDSKSGKFKYENFIEFYKCNYECFYGFNLTNDEWLAIFTSWDSQKKNYLNLDDFKNKLNLFTFYKKMHFDIKLFLQSNFPTHIDAFKFFCNNREEIGLPALNNNTNNNQSKGFITKKQFFDGINYLFPRKYTTPTIWKYYMTYFNSVTATKNPDVDNNNPDEVSFSIFSFVYYDKIIPNSSFQPSKMSNHFSKISTSRSAKFSNTPRSHTALAPNHPFVTSPHQKLITPFDTDPLEKIKRIIASSPNNDYLGYIRNQIIQSGNGIVNQFEFRNIIKHLNIGLTSIEIEDIILRSGKTWDGKINLNDFYRFVSSTDKNLQKANTNIWITLAEIKQLIYKYYSNPKLAFEFSDKNIKSLIDFDKYKSIVNEWYTRENREMPNFAWLKNTFDNIDLRKDGVIDMVEWTNAFGNTVGKWDSTSTNKQMKLLRQWETSSNVINIYKTIAKNRKLIWDKVKSFSFIKANSSLIQEDNLIRVLKEVFPTIRLTNTQWKMIVEISDKDVNGMIQFDWFIKIVEHCANREKSQPRFV